MLVVPTFSGSSIHPESESDMSNWLPWVVGGTNKPVSVRATEYRM